MTITLQKIREKKEMRKKAIEKEIEKIRKKLIDMNALKIILFGSYAQGDITSRSDLDIICVMPSTKTGKEWMKKIYDETDREVDCDIIAYTEDELKRTIPLSRFLRNALKTGKVIYEKTT
jgi:predicted nucleotidyltransferase